MTSSITEVDAIFQEYRKQWKPCAVCEIIYKRFPCRMAFGAVVCFDCETFFSDVSKLPASVCTSGEVCSRFSWAPDKCWQCYLEKCYDVGMRRSAGAPISPPSPNTCPWGAPPVSFPNPLDTSTSSASQNNDFMLCQVCGEMLKPGETGKHYGAITCEGCRKFFGRTNKRIHKCYWENRCIITPQNRNKCIECRLIKCLKVGMVRKVSPTTNQWEELSTSNFIPSGSA